MYYNQIEYLMAIDQLNRFEAALLPHQRKTDISKIYSKYKKAIKRSERKSKRFSQASIDRSWNLMRKGPYGGRKSKR